MSRKKFRIRSKPKKPVRKRTQRYAESINYYSLQYAVDQANAWDAPLAECQIEAESDGGDGYYDYGTSVYLKWTGPEDTAVFEARLVDYGRKLKLYEVWAKENKAQIAEELALREVEKGEAAKKSAQKEVGRLERELVQQQKELVKTQKKLAAMP